MDHSVANEPMLSPSSLRIGCVPKVTAVEFRGNGPSDLKLVAEDRHFIEDRCATFFQVPGGIGALASRIKGDA